MENIGEKIFNLRKGKNVSQVKLAEKLNVARYTVSRWETNTAKPTAENIKNLCEFFGVASTYFFDNVDETAAVKNDSVAAPVTETIKKETKFKTLKLVSVVVGTVLLAFLVAACGIAAYVAISPGAGGEWGNEIHIVNYAGIIYLVVGTVAVAVLITSIVLLAIKIIKFRKSK